MIYRQEVPCISGIQLCLFIFPHAIPSNFDDLAYLIYRQADRVPNITSPFKIETHCNVLEYQIVLAKLG